MRTIRTLDKTGDSVIKFDEADAEATARAKAAFDAWMEKKLPAFLTNRREGRPDEKIASFDQVEDGAEVLLVPAITAG